MQFIRRCNNIVETSLKLCEFGLSKATMTSGNVSVRLENDEFLVTPSGICPSKLLYSDIVYMNFDGSYKGELKPSSEWRIHKDIYENNENIKAVIHTHSSYCTALACTKRDIPAFHYMVAVAGGKDIKCAKYATFGTKELSENVIKALEDRKACLLANHGMIAVGKSLDEALKLAVEIEELAKQYYLVLQLGDTNIICDEEMDKIIEKFKTYGNLLKNK